MKSMFEHDSTPNGCNPGCLACEEERKSNKCDDCAMLWSALEMEDIKRLLMRTDPGGTVPSGQCPSCGALCYPVPIKENWSSEDCPFTHSELITYLEAARVALINKSTFCEIADALDLNHVELSRLFFKLRDHMKGK